MHDLFSLLRRIAWNMTGMQGFCPQRECSCFRSLHMLYFCPDCKEICCEFCSKQFACFYYCPQCIFEIPSGMACSSRHFCPRNCYLCSDCNIPALISKKKDNLIHAECPLCKYQSEFLSTSDPNYSYVFNKLQKSFQQLESTCDTTVFESTNFGMLSIEEKAKFKKTPLSVRTGYSCTKCQSPLDICVMNGMSFSFPNSKLLLKSLLCICRLNSKWIEFENKSNLLLKVQLSKNNSIAFSLQPNANEKMINFEKFKNSKFFQEGCKAWICSSDFPSLIIIESLDLRLNLQCRIDN